MPKILTILGLLYLVLWLLKIYSVFYYFRNYLLNHTFKYLSFSIILLFCFWKSSYQHGVSLLVITDNEHFHLNPLDSPLSSASFHCLSNLQPMSLAFSTVFMGSLYPKFYSVMVLFFSSLS